MARYEVVERYRRQSESRIDRLILPWAVRVVGSAATVEEATRIRDELERTNPDLAPLGIWDAASAVTDEKGITHQEWIDYPWRRGVLGGLKFWQGRS